MTEFEIKIYLNCTKDELDGLIDWFVGDSRVQGYSFIPIRLKNPVSLQQNGIDITGANIKEVKITGEVFDEKKLGAKT